MLDLINTYRCHLKMSNLFFSLFYSYTKMVKVIKVTVSGLKHRSLFHNIFLIKPLTCLL